MLGGWLTGANEATSVALKYTSPHASYAPPQASYLGPDSASAAAVAAVGNVPADYHQHLAAHLLRPSAAAAVVAGARIVA